jgi:hypothetical protein
LETRDRTIEVIAKTLFSGLTTAPTRTGRRGRRFSLSNCGGGSGHFGWWVGGNTVTTGVKRSQDAVESIFGDFSPHGLELVEEELIVSGILVHFVKSRTARVRGVHAARADGLQIAAVVEILAKSVAIVSGRGIHAAAVRQAWGVVLAEMRPSTAVVVGSKESSGAVGKTHVTGQHHFQVIGIKCNIRTNPLSLVRIGLSLLFPALVNNRFEIIVVEDALLRWFGPPTIVS